MEGCGIHAAAIEPNIFWKIKVWAKSNITFKTLLPK
jgi:hypothetical protein